jgi:hypothetical protein
LLDTHSLWADGRSCFNDAYVARALAYAAAAAGSPKVVNSIQTAAGEWSTLMGSAPIPGQVSIELA